MVEAAGVSVAKLRYGALLVNGLLCGLAGSYLTLAQNASFSPNMSAGRGFIALAEANPKRGATRLGHRREQLLGQGRHGATSVGFFESCEELRRPLRPGREPE